MYKIAITNENETFAITCGRVEDVNKAVEAEEETYPDLVVYIRDCESEKDLEDELIAVREEYATAEVIYV